MRTQVGLRRPISVFRRTGVSFCLCSTDPLRTTYQHKSWTPIRTKSSRQRHSKMARDGGPTGVFPSRIPSNAFAFSQKTKVAAGVNGSLSVVRITAGKTSRLFLSTLHIPRFRVPIHWLLTKVRLIRHVTRDCSVIAKNSILDHRLSTFHRLKEIP